MVVDGLTVAALQKFYYQIDTMGVMTIPIWIGQPTRLRDCLLSPELNFLEGWSRSATYVYADEHIVSIVEIFIVGVVAERHQPCSLACICWMNSKQPATDLSAYRVTAAIPAVLCFGDVDLLIGKGDNVIYELRSRLSHNRNSGNVC